MGRYTGPVCRLCRREGMKLFLKGDRCYMAKCSIAQEKPAPGQHGRRRSKLSEYGQQLREKQRLRRMYGMQEGQFRLFFKRALHGHGITGEKLLQLLELRLDNLVYRLGFAPSRRAARQMTLHGFIAVNGRKASIPSMNLRPGDKVQVRERGAGREAAAKCVETAETRGRVEWLAFDKATLCGEILRLPTREEIGAPVNEQLIVELYSK